MPAENLILYDQRGLLKGPVSVPDLRFFLRPIPGRAFGVIAKDLLPAHTWDAWRRPADGEAGWYGSLGA